MLADKKSRMQQLNKEDAMDHSKWKKQLKDIEYHLLVLTYPVYPA